MGQGALDYIGTKGGLEINGIIEDYYVYAGKNVSAGDFVEFINGVSSSTTEKSNSNVFTTTSTYNGYFTACLLDENTLVVAFQNLGDGVKGYATVGKVSNSVITFGEKYLFCSLRTEELDICKISEDKVAISYTSNYKTTAIIATISGTVMTFGSALSIGGGSASSTERDTQIITTEENRLLLTWTYSVISTSSSYGMKACILTVSGTGNTITKSTIFTVEVNSHNDLSLVKLSNNSAFLAYRDYASTNAEARILTISGTSVTSNTEYIIKENCSTQDLVASLISDNKLLIVLATNEDKVGIAIVATVDGTSISIGTEYVFNSNSTLRQMSNCKVVKNKAFISFVDIGNSYYGTCIIATVSLNSIVFGNNYVFNEAYSLHTIAIRNNDNSVFVVYSNSGNSNYGEIKMLNIDNAEISDNVIFNEYELQVQPATSVPCIGIAKSSGSGGDSTGHKDKIGVYRLSYKPLKNGEFNGLEGWSRAAGTAYITFSNFEDNCLLIELTKGHTSNGYAQGVSQPVSVYADHIYYGRVYYREESSNTANTITLGASSSSTYFLYTYVSSTTPNTEWTKISAYGKASETNERAQFALSVSINPDYVGNKTYFDNADLYDLTAMFGSGKEPTQEWCDENL